MYTPFNFLSPSARYLKFEDFTPIKLSDNFKFNLVKEGKSASPNPKIYIFLLLSRKSLSNKSNFR